MVNWGEAIGVAGSGIISVFIVLILLQVSVQLTSLAVGSIEKRQQGKQKSS